MANTNHDVRTSSVQKSGKTHCSESTESISQKVEFCHHSVSNKTTLSFFKEKSWCLTIWCTDNSFQNETISTCTFSALSYFGKQNLQITKPINTTPRPTVILP